MRPPRPVARMRTPQMKIRSSWSGCADSTGASLRLLESNESRPGTEPEEAPELEAESEFESVSVAIILLSPKTMPPA